MKEFKDLTDEQLQQLFYFTEKHCVHHYDLQVELVDHLAGAVASKMNKEGNTLSFEKALENVYASFGVMGFATIISTKEKSLLKWANKEKWRLFKSYFTWPKAALTALLVAVFLTMPKVLPLYGLKIVLIACTVAFVIWEVPTTIIKYRKFWRQKQKLMFTQNTYRGPAFSALLMDLFSMLLGWDWLAEGSKFNLMTYYIYAAICIMMFIGSLALIDFTTSVFKVARDQYPAAFKAV